MTSKENLAFTLINQNTSLEDAVKIAIYNDQDAMTKYGMDKESMDFYEGFTYHSKKEVEDFVKKLLSSAIACSPSHWFSGILVKALYVAIIGYSVTCNYQMLSKLLSVYLFSEEIAAEIVERLKEISKND